MEAAAVCHKIQSNLKVFDPTWGILYVWHSGPNQGCIREVITVIFCLLFILRFAYLGVSHLSSLPASQAYLPRKCPRWWGNGSEQGKGLGTSTTSFGYFTQSQVRGQGPILAFWLDDDSSSSISALFSPQAVQIMNGLFHIALGGLLMIHKNVYAPISVTLWYPLWGGIMVSKK